MGGGGNTGQSPYGDSGAAGVSAAGGRTLPDWASTLSPAGAPAAALAPPDTQRPYEAAGSPSTGLLAGPAPAAGPATGTLAQQPTGFQHDPYPTTAAATPTYAATLPPVVPETPTAPAEVPMRQIWPSGSGTASEWLKSNPGWETDFNRAEQRADGTWWVPTDPNASRPAGPQYYQGTGNVIYGGSPPASGGQR